MRSQIDRMSKPRAHELQTDESYERIFCAVPSDDPRIWHVKSREQCVGVSPCGRLFPEICSFHHFCLLLDAESAVKEAAHVPAHRRVAC